MHLEWKKKKNRLLTVDAVSLFFEGGRIRTCIIYMLASPSRRKYMGTSLVVQRLRIHLAVQGMPVRSLVRELKSNMLRGN